MPNLADSLRTTETNYSDNRGASVNLRLPSPDNTPVNMSPMKQSIKRICDVVIALFVLVPFFPIWLLIACVAWFDTKASPLYSQIRVGKDRKEFTIYKFRSMRADAEAGGPQLATKADARITPSGRIMRKFRIDEFPQFWNVLKGDMSVVGPRPERPFFTQQLMQRSPDYALLHSVRPGITSWGQVKYGYAENIEEMLDRMEYDLEYMRKISLWMDCKVLAGTVLVVLAGRGQ